MATTPKVVEAAQVAPTEPTVSSVVMMPLTITAVIKVPHTYLFEVESNTAYIREQVEVLAIGLSGSVASVDVK